VPTTRNTAAISGHFSLGWTLALNIVATLVLVTLWLTARRGGEVAGDPICGMTVDISAPVAVRQLEARSVYFCSLRCAERFDPNQANGVRDNGETDDRVDPVCFMRVSSRDALSAQGADGATYYFCGEGCRRTFVASAGLAAN
jgi:YHS domain-containing protein